MDGKTTTPVDLSSPLEDDHSVTRPPPAIADHELIRRIGSGSYGEVWLARNVLGHQRAVKIIYRNRFADPRPFEREFEGIQRFEPISRSHPSQLAILHVGKNDAAGCFYYVMELADAALATSFQCSVSSVQPGDSGEAASSPLKTENLKLETYLPHTLRHDLEERGRLPIPECVEIGLSLATALAHLHEQGLVHRDIKPSNIIFINGVAKLGDIGLVTEAGDTQSIVGTEGYLPPEGPGTPQADIFSLGKVLYEISTGLDRRQFAALPEDSWNWPDREPLMEFNEIVLRVCARDPAQRYGTADALRADLQRLKDGKSVKGARRRERQWRMLKWVSGAVVSVGLALGAVRLVYQSVPPEVAEGGPPSTNELANALCDKALRNLRGDNQPGYPEVYTNLYRAIGLDPNFARPYVGLLELVTRESLPGVTYLPEDNERAITQRLAELAPEAAATECGKAILAFYDWDFPAAESHARRSIQIAPDYELMHTAFGFMLMNWGRTVEARQELELARKLNPSKVQVHRMLGHTYYVERDFPRAIEMYRTAIDWQPRDTPSHIFLGHALLALGEYEQAIEAWKIMESFKFSRTPEAANRLNRLLQAFHQKGPRGFWEEEWNLAPTNRLYQRAVLRARLGDLAGAFDFLNQSYEAHERDGPVQDELTSLLFNEVWDPLRDDPRFQEPLDKIGFTKVNPKLKK